MYSLRVFYPGDLAPREQHHSLHHASEVLALIPRFLTEHDGCEKVAVYHEDTLLFALDCKGNRIAP